MFTDDETKRFLSKIIKDDATGCWLWSASLDSRGYGQFGVRRNGKNKNCRAHRLSYEYHRGSIPEGMELHHNCEVKRCVNPAHLVVCTHKENMLSGKWGRKQKPRCAQINEAKTHCPKGHPLAGENLHLHKDGRRQCKICYNEGRRNYMRRRREADPDGMKAYSKQHYQENKDRKNEVRRQWREKRKALGLPYM